MMTGAHNDYSACTTWLTGKNDAYLLDVYRGRLEYPELRRKVIALAAEHRAATVLIEDAGPGMNLLQDLRAAMPKGMARPIGVKPEGSKVDRMAAQSAKIEAGHVHLPNGAPWLGEFLTELLSFPNGRHDDQVDSVSQFLRWWQNEAYQHPLPCTPILVMRADMGLPRRTSTGHAGTECSIQIGTFVVASGRLASYDGWTDQPQSIDAIGPPVRRSGQARHRHAEGGPPVGIDPNPDFSYP